MNYSDPKVVVLLEYLIKVETGFKPVSDCKFLGIDRFETCLYKYDIHSIKYDYFISNRK